MKDKKFIYNLFNKGYLLNTFYSDLKFGKIRVIFEL